MADDADRVTDSDAFLERQREERRRRERQAAASRESATKCECGNPIPEGRRRAIPGVHLCVECQEHIDAPKRHYHP